MLGFISKLFGGSKSEKDVKTILPLVQKVNQFFSSYQSLSNDELRGKTVEFRSRIKEHIKEIDTEIATLSRQGEELPFNEITQKDDIYKQVDQLKKDRDKKIEEILKEILPEAFAVMKETARRFKENTEMVATATDLDRNLSVRKQHITIDGDKSIFSNSWTAG